LELRWYIRGISSAAAAAAERVVKKCKCEKCNKRNEYLGNGGIFV